MTTWGDIIDIAKNEAKQNGLYEATGFEGSAINGDWDSNFTHTFFNKYRSIAYPVQT